MIQLSNVKKIENKDIPKIVSLVEQELNERKKLYKRYSRKDKLYEIVGSNDKKKVVVPFERYIINNATGYLAGKAPSYEIEEFVKDEKKNVIKKLLDKIFVNSAKTSKEEMEVIIDYITRYNDDKSEHYRLMKDILTVRAGYEILYQSNDDEIVYSRLDPLQTIAIWDYSVPKNLLAVVNLHEEKDINGKSEKVLTIIDSESERKFRGSQETYTKDNKEGKHQWGDVPAIVVELQDNTGLFEPVIDLIDAYQELVKNIKETFSYNNNAKLKVTGYRPSNELLIPNDKGQLVVNPDRELEDRTMLDMSVFYTPEDGDIAWIEKKIDDSATQNTLKTYIELIMMNTGVPQTTDLGFTKADNASAIDRKFFSLEQMTVEAVNLLEVAYLRRWELIFNRINLKKGTKYDFRDVKITLPKNLPANENEVVDMYMKLRGLISDETIIERIPLNFDANSEMTKKEEQDEEQLNKEIDKADRFNKINNNENPNVIKEKDVKNNKEKNKNDKNVDKVNKNI